MDKRQEGKRSKKLTSASACSYISYRIISKIQKDEKITTIRYIPVRYMSYEAQHSTGTQAHRHTHVLVLRVHSSLQGTGPGRQIVGSAAALPFLEVYNYSDISQ